MNDIKNMSLNQGGNFLTRDSFNPPHSPHKLNRGNKFHNRYEELKQGQQQQPPLNNMSVRCSEISELQRNFSPINSQKTSGVRIGLGKPTLPGMGSNLTHGNSFDMNGASNGSLRMTKSNFGGGQDVADSYDHSPDRGISGPIQGFGDIEQHKEHVFEG